MNLLESSLAFTLGAEGGYQCDARDAGNWSTGIIGKGALVGTHYGISAPVLAAWVGTPVTVAQMRALTRDQAQAVYAAQYWNPVRGDDLGPGVGLSTFDMQVNAGMAGARCLQKALGVAADGWIGPATLTALAAAQPDRLARGLSASAVRALQQALRITTDGMMGEQTLLALTSCAQSRAMAVCAATHDQHVAYYRSLRQAVFQAGWLARAGARLVAALVQIQGV